jgi:hypothetical protein
MKKLIIASALLAIFSSASVWPGEVDKTVRDVKRGTRKAVRSAKDKTCELVNGKVECAAKKLKHKAQNTSEEVGDSLKK